MDASFIIATYNTRCPADKPPYDWVSRAPRYIEVIKKNKFEIFGMQEPRKNQVDDVVAGTSFRSLGGGRDDFKDAGEFNNIVYDPKRFELLDGGTFGLSEHPETPGCISWKSACPRIATWGVFRDRLTGKKFYYCNTHLDHVSEEARVNGIRLVLEHAERNGKGCPVLLTGDFNAFPDSEVYKMTSQHLHDACRISQTPHTGPAKTFHGWGSEKVRNAPIDYIFVSDGVRVLRAYTDDTKPSGEFASDHYPVIAEIVLP